MSNRIALDFETTGKNDSLKPDVPVSVAVIDLDTDEVLMNTLVQSSIPIDEDASAVHGMYSDDLDGAPSLENVLLKLAQFIHHADEVWAYNASFDFHIYINALWLENFTPRYLYAEKWRDAMALYTYRWNQPDKYREGNRNVKLTAALEMQGLPILDAHGALNDALMTASLIRHMESGQVRPFREGEPYPVKLARMTRRRTQKNVPYASFISEGGQMVNVFDGQFGTFHSAGYKLHDWINDLADGETFVPLPSIDAKVAFKDGWCNVWSVVEKDGAW